MPKGVRQGSNVGQGASKGFSKLFEENSFLSSIFQSLTSAFMKASDKLDLDFKPSSQGWRGIVQLFYKIFKVIKGLSPVVNEAFDSAQQASAETTEDLSGLGWGFQSVHDQFADLSKGKVDSTTHGGNTGPNVVPQYQAYKRDQQPKHQPKIEVQNKDGNWVRISLEP